MLPSAKNPIFLWFMFGYSKLDKSSFFLVKWFFNAWHCAKSESKKYFSNIFVGLVCQNSNTVSQFKRLVVVMLLFKLQGRNNLSKANKFSYIAVLYHVSAARTKMKSFQIVLCLTGLVFKALLTLFFSWPLLGLSN